MGREIRRTEGGYLTLAQTAQGLRQMAVSYGWSLEGIELHGVDRLLRAPPAA